MPSWEDRSKSHLIAEVSRLREDLLHIALTGLDGCECEEHYQLKAQGCIRDAARALRDSDRRLLQKEDESAQSKQGDADRTRR